MRILMTGGGTAGHVNPALAIAATLKEKHPDAEIAFVASAQPRDKAVDLVPRAGYPLHTLHIRGLARPYWSPSNIKLPYLMVKSRREAASLIRDFMPDLIVGTGGFACWPLCSMGRRMGIPTVLHESNALPGKAVLQLKNSVDLILVNFEDTIRRLDGEGKHSTAIRVGNPMMPGFATVSREEARQRIGLTSNELYILSFGGSLGAEYVNDAVVRLAAELAADPRVKLIHAAGKRDYDRIRADWDKTSAGKCGRMALVDYIYDMPIQMAAADLVISRAGAMSISELALTGKATVFIPSPYVAENHQYKNAMALVDRGAAVCVEEHTLTEGALTAQVKALIENTAKRADMERRIRDFACPDANEQIYARLKGLMKP
ncbi:MAG: UDP-N-acetylglucosamine--N-acetylmuramyl-(pentapeptide) pyrophosphoryl-undecaprenol N-acetylglucosamine transferase [Clostridia bacterium]|nr:UDP-N-acetylglucosamine--N-acetylmuramyl-(pentapeptide) pyrophosphoryl-undecaprenol N-acetylglucosamine transferase [Clostridia bacterium]